jgi:hypothetical protein
MLAQPEETTSGISRNLTLPLLPLDSDTDTRYIQLNENLQLNRNDPRVSEWPPPRATNLLVAVVPRANNGERQTRVARRPRRPRLADRDDESGGPDAQNGSPTGDGIHVGNQS